MLRIVSTQKRDVSYPLLAEKTYEVGRKQGDILFKDDSSISRQHAELQVQHNMGNITEPLLTPVLNVIDVGSKFGTFVVEAGGGGTIGEKNRIAARETVTMNVGDKVRFGLQSNEYRVVHTPLVITTSSMKAKTEFKEKILKLGGHLVPEWSDLVTHVVMEAVTLTVKAVCGLLAGKPIVTPDFIDDLLASYETRKRHPEVTDYIPPVNEKEATLTEEILKPDPSRSTLFVGKVFHFYTMKHLKRMKSCIEAGGGTAKLLSDASAKDVTSLEFIILTMNVSENATIRDQRVKDLLDKYKNCGKRFVTDTEIGLAAINNSIDKFCNPKYSMIKALLPNYNLASQSQRSSAAASAPIIPETQNMDTQPSELDDTRNVVNETDASASDEDFNSSVGVKRRGPRDAGDGLASKKRSAGDVLVRPESKRLKDLPEASAPVPSSSRPTRSSPRIQITLKNQPADALSKLFEMSDSDSDDEDVELIPETQQSTGDDETLPRINIVDVRDLQSIRSTTQQSRDDEVQQEEDDAVFRIPATPPSFAGPSQAKTRAARNKGTDFIQTVRTSLMDAKTVPCSSVPEVIEAEEEESTNSNNHDLASSGSSSKGRESSRKRPREDEEDIMKGLEERAKKINLSDAKIKMENPECEAEVAAPEAPLVLKPLMNKNNVRRELSFEVNSIVSDGVQNFKTFKKVLPTCVGSQAGLSLNTTSNSCELNTSIRGSNKSTGIKLGRLAYSPGKSAYDFDRDEDDLPALPRVEKSSGKAQVVEADIPSPDDSDEEVEEEIFAEENTRNLRGGRKRLAPAAKNTQPQKRTSPRKKGSSSTRAVRDVTPPPVPIPMDEDDAGDDEWTFQR